ncbi:hypothetical protein AF331_11645 [Rossellomorea marisflavi]|uniref:Uncharacterized protein n=1 Tax=Rossellomorea marisflavi TaxID=189381 RepID=A0A0M0G4D8_9BACI|nr:hypothetical protein [Rossellomorea marisflavi]KON84679.1 hypothetical protein AF331_11645 [Rossellomorea marisflavi]
MRTQQMIIVVLNGIIGVLIALLLSKELDVIPGILGGVAGVGVVLILMKVFSKPSPPKRDEQSVYIIRKFSTILLTITLLLLWVAVFALYYLGYESINISYLNGYFMVAGLVFLVGLGIINRR